MNEVEGKYLPIGTILLLKNATKNVMITGFASMSPETGEEIFDYSVCPYPEGFLNYNEVCVFNHDQIDKVIFQGYADEQEDNFKKLLVEQLQELNNKKVEEQNS